MSNMPYCRFDNTSKDLRDCVNSLEDMSLDEFSEMNSHEIEGAVAIRKLCERYISAYDIICGDE